jgi:aspartyl-tRNA(Asn)/glutamyl-tRNA(Gln) amidotransferase subunit B
MRSKEEAHDYRYFPEPDLPPLVIAPSRIEAARARLPELPEVRRQRLAQTYGLSEYDAAQLSGDAATARFFEAVAAVSERPKEAANWITGEVTRLLKEQGRGIDAAGVTPAGLAELIGLVGAGAISVGIARSVLERMWHTGRTAASVVADERLGLIDDRAALEAVVRDVVAANPKAVAQFRAGKTRAFDSFVGQVMKATSGRANPAIVHELIRRELERQ